MNEVVCTSTHGGAGYAAFSYWDGDAIVCGCCGERIENPYPTGGSDTNPSWPAWIAGKRGKPWDREKTPQQVCLENIRKSLRLIGAIDD